MINVYIVTYRSAVDLNNNIASILASGADVRINVINNHSEFFLEPQHERAVTVFHNRLRPDFSTGHLARNWNQALLHGFRDLTNPASEVVVTVQDDVIFKPDWMSKLIDLHRRYSFISMGGGDAFCSYLPEAVRRIGLWDERFCNIGFQEADYFLRALIYNRESSSINDLTHNRLHNEVDGNAIVSIPQWDSSDEVEGEEKTRTDSMLICVPHMKKHRQDAHLASGKFHLLMRELFKRKWGVAAAGNWTSEHYAVRKCLIQNYITYPYFEKDIEGLAEKNYMVDGGFQGYET